MARRYFWRKMRYAKNSSARGAAGGRADRKRTAAYSQRQGSGFVFPEGVDFGNGLACESGGFGVADLWDRGFIGPLQAGGDWRGSFFAFGILYGVSTGLENGKQRGGRVGGDRIGTLWVVASAAGQGKAS